MNVTPKSNPQDVAGVMGLVAFLADPDACAKRLQELAELAQLVSEAQLLAVTETAQAAEDQKAAEDASRLAKQQLEDAVVAREDVDRRTAELERRLEELALEEKKQVAYATELAELHVRLGTQATDQDAREFALVASAQNVDALKVDYESRLAKLVAAAGGK